MLVEVIPLSKPSKTVEVSPFNSAFRLLRAFDRKKRWMLLRLTWNSQFYWIAVTHYFSCSWKAFIAINATTLLSNSDQP